MRSFSKKLAFVLAAAMVVTAFAPAAKAEAAKEMAINKSSKILYVTDGTGMNDAAQVGGGKGNVAVYDFSVKNKPADWKTAYTFAWSTKDDDVVSVAKGGVVTAVGVGKATVYCKVTEKATGEVTTLKTKVTVKANAAKVEITNADKYDGAVVEVNGVVDLNRAMYDAEGEKTTKRGTLVTDYTKWVAEPAAGVEIDQKTGKFTFTEAAVAGEYKLSCYTYQSSKYTKATATSDAVVVEFQKEAFAVDQTASNAFDLLFSQTADVKIADVTVNKILAVGNGSEKIPMVVSNVVMSDDKKTAHVSLFSNFENNTTYEISVKGYDDVAVFNPVIGAPVSMTISSKSWMNGGAVILTGDGGAELTYTLWDANGTDVTNTVFGDIVYSAADNTTADYYVDGKFLYIYTNGTQATVNAEFHTYEFDDNAQEKTFKATGVFVGVDKAVESVASVSMWLEKWGNRFSGNKVPVNLGADGNDVDLKLKIKTTEWMDYEREYMNGWDVNKLVAGGKVPFVRFRSTNPDILDIQTDVWYETDNAGNPVRKQTDKVKLFKEGTSAILLELVTLNDDGSETVSTVAAISVTVADACKVSNVTFPAGASIVVGTDDDFDIEELQIVARDQYGFEWGMANWNDAAGGYAGFGKVMFADGTVISENGARGSIYLNYRKDPNWQDKIVVDGNALLADMYDAGYITFKTNGDWIVGGRTVTSISKRIVVEGQANTPGDAKSDVKFTFNVTIKKPVGNPSLDVEAGNVAGGNVGRYATNDGNGFTEGLKTLEFKVFTKQNGVKVNQETLVGKMPSNKVVASGAAIGDLYYTLTRDGKDLTDLLGGDAVNYDATTGTVSVNYTSLATLGENMLITYKGAVPGSDNPATTDKDETRYIDLGAGNYVFTVYKVAKNAGANTLYYAFVDSANAKVTVDTGSYTFVRRTEETIPEGKTIRDCFEIKDRDGNDAGTYCSYDVKETDSYIHVNSITFYEYVTTESGKYVFAAYTVKINVSLKK